MDCTNITDRNLITSLTSILGPKFDQTCESFFDSLPGELEKIRIASDSNQPRDVQRIAHSLKGASVMIGLTGIARILHLIEANSADSQQIEKLVNVDLNVCIDASKNCLSRLRS